MLDWYKIAPDLQRKWGSVLEGQRFVWLQSPSWDGVWTRQNHFTIRMARLGAEILYVENSRSLVGALRHDIGSSPALTFVPSIQEVEPGLSVMTLPPVVPGTMVSDVIGSINGALIGRFVGRWLADHGWGSYVCWCRVPQSVFALERLAPSATIYDITDNYEEFVEDRRRKKNVKEREARFLRQADLVLHTSEPLNGKRALGGGVTCLVPNGVDYQLFQKAGSPGMAAGPALADVRQPMIGYVGLVSDWIDFELLEMLGKRWPGQVAMVGPVRPELRDMARSISGLRWTGFVKERRDLPGYIAKFKVCILPFRVNELTRGMNPLKIWEYLATGKPIVSVDLPALEPARDVIDVAQSRQHFLELVASRLSDDAEQEGKQARRSLAKRYSWDVIFDRMMEYLSPLLRPVAQ